MARSRPGCSVPSTPARFRTCNAPTPGRDPASRRDAPPRVAFNIGETAAMLGKNAAALRRECERKAQTRGRPRRRGPGARHPRSQARRPLVRDRPARAARVIGAARALRGAGRRRSLSIAGRPAMVRAVAREATARRGSSSWARRINPASAPSCGTGARSWSLTFDTGTRTVARRRYRRDAAVQTRPAAVAEAQRLKKQAAERGTMEAEPEPLTFEQFVRGDFLKLVCRASSPARARGTSGFSTSASTGLWRSSATSASTPSARRTFASSRRTPSRARPDLATRSCACTRCCGARWSSGHCRTWRGCRSCRRARRSCRRRRRERGRAGASAKPRGWLRDAVALAALGGLRSPARHGRSEIGDVDLDARPPARAAGVLGRGAGGPQGPRRAGGASGTAARSPSWRRSSQDGRRVSACVVSARGRTITEDRLGGAWRRLQERLGWSPGGTTTSSGTSSRRPCSAAARTSRRSGSFSATRTWLRRRATCTRRGATWWPRSRRCRAIGGKRPIGLVPSLIEALTFS